MTFTKKEDFKQENGCVEGGCSGCFAGIILCFGVGVFPILIIPTLLAPIIGAIIGYCKKTTKIISKDPADNIDDIFKPFFLECKYCNKEFTSDMYDYTCFQCGDSFCEDCYVPLQCDCCCEYFCQECFSSGPACDYCRRTNIHY